MAQVAHEFKKKKAELGAREAAKQVGASLASFYNYVAGSDLPRMEVLKKAKEKWGIKWDLIDPAEIVRSQKVQSPQQYVLSFLEALREEDIEISKVTPSKRDPQKESVLQITLKIRFSA